RRGDRAEDDRVGRPDDRQDEHEPDVVRLPDRRHRLVRVVTNAPAALAPPGRQLPDARAVVGAGEHRVQGEPAEGEYERHVVQVHRGAYLASLPLALEAGAASGAPASRRRTQATTRASPA